MKYNILFAVLLGVASVVYGQNTTTGTPIPIEIIEENVNATNGAISPVFDSFGNVIGDLVEATTQTVNGTIILSGTVVDRITGDVIGVLTIVGGTVGKIVDAGGNIVETGVTVSTDLLNKIMGALGDAIDSTVGAVTSVANSTVDVVTTVVNSTGTAVTDLVGGAIKAINGLFRLIG